jgi:PAS domain S-box-containing protein
MIRKQMGVVKMVKSQQKIEILTIFKKKENIKLLEEAKDKINNSNIEILINPIKSNKLTYQSLVNHDIIISLQTSISDPNFQKFIEFGTLSSDNYITVLGLKNEDYDELTNNTKNRIDYFFDVEEISKTRFETILINIIKLKKLKNKNKNLLYSQEKFKSLFNNLNDAVLFHDLKGNIIEVNETACKRLNYSREELLEKNISEIDSPEFRKFINKRIKQLKSKRSILFETEHVTRERNIIPVEVNSILIPYEGKKAILSIARDIELRKLEEKKYQNTLRKYKQLHKEMELIIDHIPGLVYYKDTKNRFLRVNKNLAKAHDMTKEEMSGKSCFEIFPEEQAQAYWEDDLEVIESGEPKLFIEEKWQTPDGLRWTSTSKIPLTGEDGEIKGIIGFSMDLTEKKLIEQELIKSQKELKTRNKISNLFLKYRDEDLYNEILDYLLEIFDSNIGFFSYINNEGDLICPTMEGGVWEKCNIPEKGTIFPKDSWGGLWAKSLKKNEIIVSYGPFNLPNGHVSLKNVICIPIILQDKVIGQISLGNKEGGYNDKDIELLDTISNKIAPILDSRLRRKQEKAKRKKTQKKLRKSEKKYRSILENIKEGYFEIDLEGCFTFINKAMCRITGLKEDELIGNDLTRFISNDTEERLKIKFEEILKTRKGNKNIEFKFVKNRNKEIYIETSAYPLYDSDDHMIGYFGLSRDITERKKAEILRKEFQKELEEKVTERTKKLNQALEKKKRYMDQILKASEFKSEFLASMSHELRTPLNAIVGFTDLLLEESTGKLNELQKDYLKDVDDSSEDLLNMINQILDISKIEAGQLNLDLKGFSIKNMINQIKPLFKSKIEKKDLEFIRKGFDKVDYIFADPIKIKQILINLLNNAIKYTLEGRIELKIMESEKEWVFEVSDTGIGIEEDNYDLVFKEFKRGNSPFVNSKKGTGLGLPLTKRLVNLHGGKIWFKSERGKGTTFFFTIPKGK